MNNTRSSSREFPVNYELQVLASYLCLYTASMRYLGHMSFWCSHNEGITPLGFIRGNEKLANAKLRNAAALSHRSNQNMSAAVGWQLHHLKIQAQKGWSNTVFGHLSHLDWCLLNLVNSDEQLFLERCFLFFEKMWSWKHLYLPVSRCCPHSHLTILFQSFPSFQQLSPMDICQGWKSRKS